MIKASLTFLLCQTKVAIYKVDKLILLTTEEIHKDQRSAQAMQTLEFHIQYTDQRNTGQLQQNRLDEGIITQVRMALSHLTDMNITMKDTKIRTVNIPSRNKIPATEIHKLRYITMKHIRTNLPSYD